VAKERKLNRYVLGQCRNVQVSKSTFIFFYISKDLSFWEETSKGDAHLRAVGGNKEERKREF
jgi:hypothetical protein